MSNLIVLVVQDENVKRRKGLTSSVNYFPSHTSGPSLADLPDFFDKSTFQPPSVRTRARARSSVDRRASSVLTGDKGRV